MWYTQTPEGPVLVAAAGEDEDRAKLRLNALLSSAGTGRFDAMLVPEGVRTTDLREIAEGALSWRELPIPLTDTEMTGNDHYGCIVGRIESIERRGNEIWANGSFDMDSEEGREACRRVDEQLKRWVSIDLEVIEMEFIPVDDQCDDESSDPDDWCRYVMRVLEGRIMGAAMCGFPAFPQAVIVPEGAEVPEASEDGRAEPEMVAASAATVTSGFLHTSLMQPPADFNGAWPPFRAPEPLVAHAEIAKPPAEWFTRPDLDGPTHMGGLDEGRIFAHAAAWGTCHVGIPGVCTTAPRSKSGYRYYTLGETLCAGGERVLTGPIIMGTNHAAQKLAAQDAVDHYAHTGAAVADVVIGEDEFGIWVAGALRPGLSEETLAVLRASSLSGDWRRIDGHLELVAILVVNTPGFPVPRAVVASGEQVSLVGAGSVPPCDCNDDERVAELMAKVPMPTNRLLARLKRDEESLLAKVKRG